MTQNSYSQPFPIPKNLVFFELLLRTTCSRRL